MKLGLQLVLLLQLLTCSVWLRVSAQNPFEQLATGALDMGTQLMGGMQEGSKADQEANFDSPLMSGSSKTLAGQGNAMRPPGFGDSDESYERRRRRRRRSAHPALQRSKRAPCWNMMGATTESSDDVEERRRARKRAVNNRTRSRVSRPTTKNKLVEGQRRRRQAVPVDPAQGPSLGERFAGMWLSMVDNMADLAQQMHQKIRGAVAQGAAGNQT